jgi:hypothetical protein
VPAGLQVQSWFKQNIAGTANEALAPGTGDTNTFFNVPQGSKAYLAEVWAVNNASPMDLSLVASRFHDQQSGIVYKVVDGCDARAARAPDAAQLAGYRPADFPVRRAHGAGGRHRSRRRERDARSLLRRHSGHRGPLRDVRSVVAAAGNQVGIRSTLTAGAGQWGSTVALNASDNRLHANRDYAVLGFTAEAPLAAVAIQGVDVGNLRAGGPVLADGGHDGSLFVDFAKAYNAALIPVINSNNAGSRCCRPRTRTLIRFRSR